MSIFSPEQEELRTTVRTFLERTSPESSVRRFMETDEGYDPAVWKQLSEQLGLPGLHIPEEYGGSGFGFVELCLVLEEMGAALLPSPFLASAVLAASALLASDDEEAKKELLPGIASGATIATLAYANDTGQFDELFRAVAKEINSGAYRRPPSLNWGGDRSHAGDVLPSPNLFRPASLQIPGLQ